MSLSIPPEVPTLDDEAYAQWEAGLEFTEELAGRSADEQARAVAEQNRSNHLRDLSIFAITHAPFLKDGDEADQMLHHLGQSGLELGVKRVGREGKLLVPRVPMDVFNTVRRLPPQQQLSRIVLLSTIIHNPGFSWAQEEEILEALGQADTARTVSAAKERYYYSSFILGAAALKTYLTSRKKQKLHSVYRPEKEALYARGNSLVKYYEAHLSRRALKNKAMRRS